MSSGKHTRGGGVYRGLPAFVRRPPWSVAAGALSVVCEVLHYYDDSLETGAGCGEARGGFWWLGGVDGVVRVVGCFHAPLSKAGDADCCWWVGVYLSWRIGCWVGGRCLGRVCQASKILEDGPEVFVKLL